MQGMAVISATILAGLSVESAAAQDGRGPDAAAATKPAPSQSVQASTTDIVVTARKRSERIQDVPISMEVVSGATLAQFNTNDVRSMAKLTPNVSILQTSSNIGIYIRGFGSSPANYGFDQSVSLYFDGIYAGRTQQAQAPFFDLQRVEVLRGPQGALFGKNTAAGAISVVSAGPTDTFSAAATASYNFDLKGPDLSGYVSGPIADNLAVRLALKYVDQDGYIKNTATNESQPSNRMKLARLTVRYTPTDTFDYTVKAEYSDRVVKGSAIVSSPLDGPQDPHDYRTTGPNPLGAEGATNTSWLVSGTGNLRFGDYTLTSITGYSSYNAGRINSYDETNPSGGVADNTVFNSFPERFHQYSQEFRILSPTNKRLEFIVGAYFDWSKYDMANNFALNVNTPPYLVYAAALATYFDQSARTASAFGQATFHLTDTIRAIGSLRYTHTSKHGTTSSTLLSGPFAIFPVNTSADARLGEDDVDPSFTLQYDVLPRVMLYATYGRGSKSGGFVANQFGTTNADFQFAPERSTNYEIGIKSTVADGHLILNASLYDTMFKDLQVSVYDPQVVAFQTGNAASASSKGIEATVGWYPMKGLDVNFSGAYQNVKYDNYPGAACLASQTTAQCDPNNPASVAANNIEGSPLPYSSKLSFSTTGHYRLELTHTSAIDTTVTVTGRSKYFDSDDESPLYGLQKGFAKIDARIQYGPASGAWHVAVVGKNLTDQFTSTFAFSFPFPLTTVPRAMLVVDERRNLAIEAGFKF